jgi:hypothetical protein
MGGRDDLDLIAWRPENKAAGWKTSPTSALIRVIAGLFAEVPDWSGNTQVFKGNDPFGSLGPLFVRVAKTMDANAIGTRSRFRKGSLAAVVWHTTPSHQFRGSSAAKLLFSEAAFWTFPGSAAMEERREASVKKPKLSLHYDLKGDKFLSTFLSGSLQSSYDSILDREYDILTKGLTGITPLHLMKRQLETVEIPFDDVSPMDVLIILLGFAKACEHKRQIANGHGIKELKYVTNYSFMDVIGGKLGFHFRTHKRRKSNIHEWTKHFQWKAWASFTTVEELRQSIDGEKRRHALDVALLTINEAAVTYFTSPQARAVPFNVFNIQGRDQRIATVQNDCCKLYLASMEGGTGSKLAHLSLPQLP